MAPFELGLAVIAALPSSGVYVSVMKFFVGLLAFASGRVNEQEKISNSPFFAPVFVNS